MEALKPNPILKFNENQLKDVRKALGYEDVNKLKQDIEHFRDWIKKQDHFRVKEIDDGYLERQLIYNKGSIQRTKQKFDTFCTYVNLMPEFLQNYDMKNEFRSLNNVLQTCLLPKPTKDNYRIIVTASTGVDDINSNYIEYYRHLIAGYEYIVDNTKITMATMAKINPFVAHKALHLIVHGIGQRIKKNHFITGSKFFDVLFGMVNQSVSSKMKQRLIVHSSLESLYDHIPRELLPKDLGGEERSLQELCELTFKELSSDEHIAHMKFMETFGTDETKRPSDQFTEVYSGTPGSFKVLCVD